jgi:hypothetical protein
MKTKTLLCFVALFITLSSCAHKKARNITAHTPLEDQYWNDMALDSTQWQTSILNILEENNPALYNQILKDSKDPYVTMFWGKSLNFDSGVKKKIVDDRIIEDLQKLFNIKNDNKIVHAGIMHTYGYLFSTINTPYGYKRQRWIAPTLNSAFAMEGNSFSPEAIDGGLLSNVTYFSGMLAFKNKNDLSILKNVSNEVFTYDYSKLAIDRVEEEIKGHTLVTTLVRFPVKILVEKNDYLLIYSTIDHTLNKEYLVTAFPINAESYEKIIAPETMGPNQKITIRYNAYLEGFENNLTGARKLIKK